VPAIVTRNGKSRQKLDARGVKRRAERMLSSLELASAELSVVLTGDGEIEALNTRHRKKAKPTDVLAFPMDPSGKGLGGTDGLLGDVVISLDTAARQARDHRHGLMDEVTHLLAHGILHLVGYDHRTDAEERRMNTAAARLVAASGKPRRSPRTVPTVAQRSRVTSRAR
jgi:probable rRNA maturation factor